MTDTPNVYIAAAILDFSGYVVGGECPQDLYVFVHSEERYLQFVSRGEKLTSHKVETIRKLAGSNLFVKNDPTQVARVETARDRFLADAKAGLAKLDPRKIYEGEALGPEAEQCLKGIYAGLLDPSKINPVEMTETLSELSESLLNTLVPEVRDVKVNLLKHLANLSYMNHASAMMTFSVLVALANDFKSKTTFRHLSTACLVMDAGLGDLEDHWIEMYYRQRDQLPTHIWDRIRNHPVKSQQLVAYLPLSSDLLNQLILTHHELHNGQGYHRGIQSGNILQMARMLALAVDLFEVSKGHELRGTPLALKDLFMAMREGNVDVHLRRHQFRLIDNLLEYMGLKNQGRRAA